MGMFICTSTDPLTPGSWSEPIPVALTGIDPDLFFDDDGSVYVSCTRVPAKIPQEYTFPKDGNWGIQQVKIDIATGRLFCEPYFIYSGTGGKWPEGPHIYKFKGSYYLLLAEGGTDYGHMVTIAKGNCPAGPWDPCPYNPILSNRSLHSPLQGVGHVDLIESESGDWFAFFHAIRPQGFPQGHILGRETCFAPVRWENGWPVIGSVENPGRAFVEYSASLPGAISNIPVTSVRKRLEQPFGNNSLSPTWNMLGHIGDSIVKVDTNSLTLKGTSHGISDGSEAVFIGLRHQHLRCKSYVSVSMPSITDADDEAGFCVFANSKYHYEVVLMRNGLVFRRKIGTLETETKAVSTETSDFLTLWISYESEWYKLGYVDVLGKEIEVGKGEGLFLSTEVAGGYTGVYFGCFVKSNAGNEAFFKDFVYEYEE
ncbi:hypothetical protein HK098_004921 [Nowakowskiella sp. JEL0407]|nr:hypothetical protein HK098_004921 [Nowakowskiella sp. JEL0407]